jgi:hypothetical protein
MIRPENARAIAAANGSVHSASAEPSRGTRIRPNVGKGRSRRSADGLLFVALPSLRRTAPLRFNAVVNTGGESFPARTRDQARAGRRARGFHQGRSPKTIHPLDLHYLNLRRELHRTFQTLALAA